MRPIKFRAWENNWMNYNPADPEPTNINEVIKNYGFPLMQYTGLKDKNGREIYEGDILKIPHDLYKMFRELGWQGKEDGLELIVWEDGRGFMGKDLNSLKEGWSLHNIPGRYLWIMNMPAKSEIIGNIYENPELLKAGEGK